MVLILIRAIWLLKCKGLWLPAGILQAISHAAYASGNQHVSSSALPCILTRMNETLWPEPELVEGTLQIPLRIPQNELEIVTRENVIFLDRLPLTPDLRQVKDEWTNKNGNSYCSNFYFIAVCIYFSMCNKV